MVAIYNDRFDVAATLIELGSDVNDGSLYVAVEMRDATTDQFAFDGSRLRPDHPNTLTALDLMKLLLERGADPNKRVRRPVPLHVDAEHRPVRQHAVLPRGRRGRRRSAEGDDRARRQSRSDAAGAAGAADRDSRAHSAGGRAPRQSERRPHAGDGGDDRRPRAGDDRRARPTSATARRRIASRAAASPKTRSRCCSRRAPTRTRRGPTARRCCTRRRGPATSR